MKQEILLKLKKIEEKENVTIIYAVESGSRSWGFESKDSDYDVRFIYVRTENDYLSIFPLKDTIEWELNDVYDINGWDIKKALKLLYSSNPTLFEWKNSSIVYKTSSAWKLTYHAFDTYFQVQKALHHYYHMSLTAYQKKDNLKKYLYTLRTVLSCLWIIEKKTPCPIEISTLIDDQLPSDLQPLAYYLMKIKKDHKEKDLFPTFNELDKYIEKSLIYIQSQLSSYYQVLNTDLLNQTFIDILKATS